MTWIEHLILKRLALHPMSTTRDVGRWRLTPEWRTEKVRLILYRLRNAGLVRRERIYPVAGIFWSVTASGREALSVKEKAG